MALLGLMASLLTAVLVAVQFRDALAAVPAFVVVPREPLSEACRRAAASIEEVIAPSYVSRSFGEQESVLLRRAAQLVQLQCPAWLVARAGMYIGIVRALGLRRAVDAKAAFATALAYDVHARPDPALANEQVDKLFEAALSQPGIRDDAQGSPDAAPPNDGTGP